MTQKELLYFEDAIGHEKSIISIINATINNLEDESLINFMKEELTKHKDLEEKLINLLEVKSNE